MAALADGGTALGAPISDRVEGGPGGVGFILGCPPNHVGLPSAYMVGIGVKAGAWVNAIRLQCAPLQHANKKFGAPVPTRFVGGEGRVVESNCRDNQYVSAMKWGFTRDGNKPKYVDYIQFTCTSLPGTPPSTTTHCLDTGNGCWDRHPSPGSYNGYGLAYETKACQPLYHVMSAAYRVEGRAGAALDALGALSCALTGYRTDQ